MLSIHNIGGRMILRNRNRLIDYKQVKEIFLRKKRIDCGNLHLIKNELLSDCKIL